MNWNTKISTQGPFRSKKSLIFGVTKGLADHYGLSTLTIRIIFLAGALLLFFWPVVVIYLVLAFIMPEEPLIVPNSDSEKEFWILGQANPQGVISNIQRRTEIMEARMRRLEDHVTSRAFRKTFS